MKIIIQFGIIRTFAFCYKQWRILNWLLHYKLPRVFYLASSTLTCSKGIEGAKCS